MRVGGWKTPSMFRRYNLVDQRDLSEAAERLSGFLAQAASASLTIVPLDAARATRVGRVRLQKTPTIGEHGQNTDNRGAAAVAPADSTAVIS